MKPNGVTEVTFPISCELMNVVLYGIETCRVVSFEELERLDHSFFGTLYERRNAKHRHEIIADMLLNKFLVFPRLNFIADNLDMYLKGAGVLFVLSIDRDRLQRWLDNEKSDIKSSEEPRREGISASGHINHNVVVLPIDQVIQEEFNGTNF